MMENATYSVISPEGASVILFGDTSHASETIEKAWNPIDDLLAQGIVDQVVPEPPDGAHAQPDLAISAAKTALRSSLAQLLPLSESERLLKRRARYRHAGLIART
jgi:acetyl-CoA carboxylase carboxyl transferase subunit beta